MLFIKSLHILFVTAWFAGLFYLPRIFVNLALDDNQAVQARLLLMAHKLYRFMTMLAIPALGLGLYLWLGIGIGSGQQWLYAKLVFVLLIIGYHHGCAVLLKKFAQGKNTHSPRWYRWFNEIPVLLLLVVILLVIFKNTLI